MAGTPTDAGDSAKSPAASPPINADTILFRMPTTAAAKPEGQDKPVEAAPATDVTTKLQAENPYLNQPAAGTSAEVARIAASQTPTGTVREQTVQTTDGPQSVKIVQQGEKQTIFNNSGQQLQETRVNGQPVYSPVKPEVAKPAVAKPEGASVSPEAAVARPAVAPTVVRESGPTAQSIQAKAIETAAADTRAVQVRGVTNDTNSGTTPGRNPTEGKTILPSDVPRVVTPVADARTPAVEPRVQPTETRSQAVEPRAATTNDGKATDGKSTGTPVSADTPQVTAKPNNPVTVSPTIPADRVPAVTPRTDGTTPNPAAVAERTVAANQPFIDQVKAQERARDNAIATGTDGRPNITALQTPGQTTSPRPETPVKSDTPAPVTNPTIRPDVSLVNVGNLGGQPIDKGIQNPTAPRPVEGQPPSQPRPGDGQLPSQPRPLEGQIPGQIPGQIIGQPRPGDGQLSAQPPVGQQLRPGDLPPVGQPIVRPGDVLQPGQRPLDGALVPGQLGQQKAPDGTPLKPGEAVPGKNPVHIDEEIAARLKDLGQNLKPGTPGSEIGKGLPADLAALNLGKDGKPLTPAGLLDGKAEIKVDLQALAQNAAKPGSGVELNTVLKGLGLEGTKPGDMHGVINVDAKTLANLDPKAVEALVKAQAEMLGKGNTAEVSKGIGVELAGAKGDMHGIDLKGLDASKQLDPLKTMEANKAQSALTAMDLANQLNKPLPLDKVPGAELNLKPEPAKAEIGKAEIGKAEAGIGLAAKPEAGTKPESGIKPEAVVKTDATGTKVGEPIPNASVTEAMRAENSAIKEPGDGFGQSELGLEDGGEEERKEKEKRLAFSAKEEAEWELKEQKTRKQTEESLLEEEQKNNAKNAMLAAMLAQTKEQEAERERQLLMEEAKRKGEDKRRRYVVKDKDTLESIAKKQLRDVRLSALIYEINKHMLPVRMEKGRQVVDPRPGTSIWLPSEADIKQFRSRLYANPRSTTLPGSTPGGGAAGAGMTAEQELAAQFGANWDGKNKSAASVSAGMMGAAVAKSQVRRANIEKILGPMGQKAGETARIRYIVRLGDSLDGVASKHPALKDAELWPLLASINELSDEVDDDDKPVATLRRGMVLNLPTPLEIEQYRNAVDPDEQAESDMSPELASAMTESVSQVLSATRSHTQLNATLDKQALGDASANEVTALTQKTTGTVLDAAELRARAAAHAAAAAAAEAAAAAAEAAAMAGDAGPDADEYDDYDTDYESDVDDIETPQMVSPVVSPVDPSPVFPSQPAVSSVVPPPAPVAPVVTPPAVVPASPALPSQVAAQAAPGSVPGASAPPAINPKNLLNPTMPLPRSTQGNLPAMPQSSQSITGPVAPVNPGISAPAPNIHPVTGYGAAPSQQSQVHAQPSPQPQLPTPQPQAQPNPQPQPNSQSQPSLQPQQNPQLQPTFTPVGGNQDPNQTAGGPVTQPVAAPGMEILLREPIIAGDRLMWELYTGIRLVKSSVKWEPAIGVFRAQLEMLIGPVWYPVIFYEVFPTGSVRHEYSPGGKRKSVRIDLPPAAVQELADNDLVSKWTIYCRAYLAQMQGPKA